MKEIEVFLPLSSGLSLSFHFSIEKNEYCKILFKRERKKPSYKSPKDREEMKKRKILLTLQAGLSLGRVGAV